MEEEKIKKVVRNLTQAMINQDMQVLNELLASQATLTHITGIVQTKEEWLSQIKVGTMKYFASVEEELKIEKLEGKKAYAQVKNRVTAKIYGTKNTWPLQLNFELEKSNNNWIIVSLNASLY